MHFLSYQLPPASELKLGLKKTRAGQQRSSVKRQRKCIFSGFLQLYCSKSKCASQCQVLGKSVDWFITNCKWDGRQFLHYGYAIVEETHSVQRAIATGKDIFFTKIPCAQSCKSLNCMSGVSKKRKFIEVRCSWRPNVNTEICVTNVCDSGQGTLICAPCLWQWSLEHSYKCARCDKSHNVTQPAMLWWLATRYF